jgi:hypothetical protein
MLAIALTQGAGGCGDDQFGKFHRHQNSLNEIRSEEILKRALRGGLPPVTGHAARFWSDGFRLAYFCADRRSRPDRITKSGAWDAIFQRSEAICDVARAAGLRAPVTANGRVLVLGVTWLYFYGYPLNTDVRPAVPWWAPVPETNNRLAPHGATAGSFDYCRA